MSIQILSMHSSKQNLFVDDQSNAYKLDNRVFNGTNTGQNVDSTLRCYAIIETDPNELEQIIDLLRQLFPATRIMEYKSHNLSSNAITSKQQASSDKSTDCTHNSLLLSKSSLESDSNNDQITSNINSQAIK